MSRCIIIGAGDLTVGNIPLKEDDYVIAVDGGINYCSVLEIEPDFMIGDFDSVSEEQREAILALYNQLEEAENCENKTDYKGNNCHKRIEILNPMKDDTDMLAAIKHALALGYKDFLLYGGTGGRLEHTFANIQCLLYLKNHDAKGYLMDGNGMIFVMQNESVTLRNTLEGYMSMFALSGKAEGVTIKNMKYELDNATITNDFPIGISNEFIGKEATLEVKNGEVVVMISYVVD